MPISLAEVFDALVEDESVSKRYADLVRRYVKQGALLDLACGTGTISQQLKTEFDITGLDLDEAMLVQFQKRNPGLKTILGSMTDLNQLGSYDAILLFGDSLNYLLTLEEVKKTLSEAISHLSEKGVFLFDMHTPDRYDEFKDEYCEEGLVLNHPFQWTIQSLPEMLINHHFAFYDEAGHAQTISFDQKVYPLEDITSILDELHVIYDLYSDFKPGIHPETEKTLIAVRRS
jgi:SAM-dependent methyltransferase